MAREIVRVGIHQFVRCEEYVMIADASDLGLGVGEWPRTLAVADDTGRIVHFHRNRRLFADVGGFVYEDELTHAFELHVIND